MVKIRKLVKIEDIKEVNFKEQAINKKKTILRSFETVFSCQRQFRILWRSLNSQDIGDFEGKMESEKFEEKSENFAFWQTKKSLLL